MEQVLIRAEIFGENVAGQKHIHLLANNADGIHFWTDDKSIVRFIEPDPDTVSRPQGHWIEDGYYGLPCVCSYCGHEGQKEWKYCPFCGDKKGGAV